MGHDLPVAPTVRPLSNALGAEVTGIDLTTVTPDDVAEVRALLLEHLVCFFPGQRLTRDAHVALGRAFGDLEVNPNLPGPEGGPREMVELRASQGGIADEWHTDVTFLPSPSVMSIMHMVECPPIGGDTMWSNQYLAYEDLSPPLREMLEGLSALHDAEPHGKPDMKAHHPVVRVHPETGRRSLFVNTQFTRRIVEVSHAESEALLAFLKAWSIQDRFCVRYAWTPGAVAIWDNRVTQHHVVNDFSGERIIQRVTVLGDVPTGEAPRWDPYAPSRRGSVARHDTVLARDLRAAATLD
jgi:taurine dioxygenase